MSGPGFLLYRCRLCHALERSPRVPELIRALTLLAMGDPLPREWGIIYRGATDVHACAGGSTAGIADLIGGRTEADFAAAVVKSEPTAAIRAKRAMTGDDDDDGDDGA
jgi:hypothetical protein